MAQLAKAAQMPTATGRAAKFARYAWVMESMFDEIIGELADELTPTDSQMMGSWFQEFGKLVEWCGSGDDTVLPPRLRKYFAEQLAITAGENH